MVDPTDPGGYEVRADRQLERVRRQVREANQSDILQTVRKGRRGTITSPKPNQMHKTAWASGTIRNNARNLRTLAGEIEGLDEAEYEGNEWDEVEGNSDYPDRLLDMDPDSLNTLIEELAIERRWSDGTERDYCMSLRNHLLAHEQIEDARRIRYPQVGHDDAAVDIDTVPSREDLLSLIESEHPRDKAMLAVLWESASRVTAVSALKVKHWTPKERSYGILQLPGKHVEGLKGAEYDAKPITFARGHLDNWLSEHPLSDDDDAPLFCGTRSQDDPSEHMSPHSITLQVKRIARRTTGVNDANVSPHTLKHGRGTEMRASTKYSKEDIEQVMDWAEGTPMHARYEHVSETEEAERILRKHGYDPEDEGDRIEQHECPRCGTIVDSGEQYCPNCSLRQNDGRPRWWQIYCNFTTEDDPVRVRYDKDLPPPTVSALTPGVFDHVVTRLLNAMLVTADEEIAEQLGCDTEQQLTEDDARWVFDNVPDATRDHRGEYPIARMLRNMNSDDLESP